MKNNILLAVAVICIGVATLMNGMTIHALAQRIVVLEQGR